MHVFNCVVGSYTVIFVTSAPQQFCRLQLCFHERLWRMCARPSKFLTSSRALECLSGVGGRSETYRVMAAQRRIPGTESLVPDSQRSTDNPSRSRYTDSTLRDAT